MSRQSAAWRLVMVLEAGFAVWLGGCTRPAGLTQTPLLPPAGASTQAAVLPAIQAGTGGQSTSTAQLAAPAQQGELGEVTSTPAGTTRYAVLFLAEGEILNMRSGPGVMNDIVDTLAANGRDLTPTGERQEVDSVLWVEIQRADGITGWVSGQYLTEQTLAQQMCSDPQVGGLLDGLVNAVRSQDGAALAELASPIHGLTFHQAVWNAPVLIADSQAITALFTSTEGFDWGVDEAGELVSGAFRDVILPWLEDVLMQSHTRHCNTLEQGVAAGPTNDGIYWPYDYRSLNYVALFRPAAAGQEQDWRTWVAGIEYIEGRPYLVVLIPYSY